ncbi:MAG: peptide chain release factor 1 [Elusimicrobia bacterium]|nr:peptide chain release factor 1 [Elusimicrobiota bacterium]
MADKLHLLETEFRSIEERLASSPPPPPAERQALARRHAELMGLVRLIEEQRRLERALADAEALLHGPDAELRELAALEKGDLSAKLAGLQALLRRELIPKDPRDSKNVFVEIRAGAGGDEAALFAAELVRMYTRFAQDRGWRADLVELTGTGLKGAKQATLHVKGEGAFSWLKFEGGVHRVQRVPVTEASGRIHTSTCTVAVMAEAEETEVEINPKDLRIDTYRAGGAGGQNVNKVETAIRITHLPTNTVVQCQDERSQGQNRLKAMMMLRAKLATVAADEAKTQETEDRRRQVGTGERSEKIRTYNFPQNRVTDHRLEQSWHNLPAILEGGLGPVLESLRQDEEERLLKTAT